MLEGTTKNVEPSLSFCTPPTHRYMSSTIPISQFAPPSVLSTPFTPSHQSTAAHSLRPPSGNKVADLALLPEEIRGRIDNVPLYTLVNQKDLFLVLKSHSEPPPAAESPAAATSAVDQVSVLALAQLGGFI